MQPSEFEQMQRFCDEHHLRLADIEQAPYHFYPNMEFIKEWINKEAFGRPRFAAAADVLRVSILSEEGGHYVDGDIVPLASIADEDWHCQNGHYQLINAAVLTDTLLLYSMSMMGALPQHHVYLAANALYKDIHRTIFDSLEAYVKPGVGIANQHIIYTTGYFLSAAGHQMNLPPTQIRYMSHEIMQGSKCYKKVNIQMERSYGADENHFPEKIMMQHVGFINMRANQLDKIIKEQMEEEANLQSMGSDPPGI